jgi:membrane-bound metal-dependent hydrolase YbcI (DUF457 family)
MDIFTHSMNGLLIGSVSTNRKEKLIAYLFTGALASVLVDLPDVCLLINDDLYFKYHRVFTHTLIGAPFFAVLAALPAYRRVHKWFASLYLIALLSILAHFAMDAACEWPIMLFYPFTRRDFSLGFFVFSSRAVLFTLTILTLGVLFFKRGIVRNT